MDLETKEAIGNLQGKVDQILETLQILARVEERQSLAANVMVKVEARLNGHSERIRAIESQMSANHAKVSGIDKVMWLAIGVALGCVPVLLQAQLGG